ncbi:MAG: hypothetical protein AAGA65_21575 [Actinomycetota bacterium]
MRDLISFALFLLLLVIVPTFVIAGLWEMARGRSIWPRLPVRAHIRFSGLIKLATAAAVVCIPLLAAPIAESRTGWMDEDGDGIIDGYRMADWLDINGWTLSTIWVALGWPMILGLALVALRIDRRSTARGLDVKAF